jgi:hypothetical protein
MGANRSERTRQQLRRRLSRLSKLKLREVAELRSSCKQWDPSLSQRQSLLLTCLARGLVGVSRPKSLLLSTEVGEHELPVFRRRDKTDRFLLSCVSRPYIRPTPNYHIHVQPKVSQRLVA